VIGVLLIVAFTLGMGLVGWVVVDGSSPRTIHTSDGRAINLGVSWPGALDSCVSDSTVNVLPNCYREPVDRGSFVKQPWSTYSTFAFCAVGLFILAMADRSKSRDQTWLGFVALFMGPGSALFHGTLTSWGGWGDQLSMYALLASIITCDLTHLKRRPERYTRWFIALLALATVLKGVTGELSTLVFIVMGVGTGVFALVSWGWLLKPAGYARAGLRLALAFGLLALSIVPWVLSNPFAGDPVEVPYHAAWHLLSALFVAAYAWYLRSERAYVVEQEPAPEPSLAV
jgi:hypothetical protein